MYQDFYPNLKKERENLKGVLANQVSQKDLKKDPTLADWPISSRQDVTERAYKEWLDKTVNPTTQEYYLARDENNLPIRELNPNY